MRLANTKERSGYVDACVVFVRTLTPTTPGVRQRGLRARPPERRGKGPPSIYATDAWSEWVGKAKFGVGKWDAKSLLMIISSCFHPVVSTVPSSGTSVSFAPCFTRLVPVTQAD